MTCAYSVFSYTLPVPGADSNAYVLYSTVGYGSAYFHQMGGNHRVRIDVAHTQNGTFNLYKSRDKGVTWRLVDTLAANSGPAASSVFDVIIEPFLDWKVEWANGGAAQAYFEPDVAILPYRTSAVAGDTPPPVEEFVVDDVGGGGDIIDDQGTGEEILDA